MSRPTCPDEILEKINKANEFNSKEMYAEQLDLLEAAIQICPHSAVAHHNLGVALANLERYDAAENHFCRAIELAPLNAALDLAVPVPYNQAEENLAKLRIIRIKERATRVRAPRAGAARKRGTWDFFFSYKSENANEVRRVAEYLMANGFRVWFAEYEVVLRNYEEFQRLIRKGIRNCSFAILFTTNSYSQSKHCGDEAAWLKEHFEKEPWRIIEVSLEEPNNARQVVGASEWFRARCAPITFDPSGFVLTKWSANPADGTDVVSFEGEPGPVRFGFNVYFHFSPQAAPGQPFQIDNDRSLYDELRAYASHFMGQTGKQGIFLRERGLHLIWTNGRTQFALTHSFLWLRMRKYSVILQLPRPIQLIFTFGVTGSFDDFCRLVPLMDRVLESIRVEISEKTQ